MKKISVILATNSDKAYQYLVPADFNIKKGMIVKAPFRSRELFGIIWDDSDEKIEKSKLKEIIDYYQISTLGDAQDFADMNEGRLRQAACSNSHGGL